MYAHTPSWKETETETIKKKKNALYNNMSTKDTSEANIQQELARLYCKVESGPAGSEGFPLHGICSVKEP